MPKYDYRCEHNGRTLEVAHAMSDRVATWGELCALANVECGTTPADAPVRKIISGGFVATGASDSGSTHACTAPACCGGTCGPTD